MTNTANPISRDVFVALSAAGFKPSRAERRHTTYRQWTKYLDGAFAVWSFDDGALAIVRAYSTNGNQLNARKFTAALEAAGFTVTEQSENYDKYVALRVTR